MKYLYPLTFTKDWESLPCCIFKLEKEDLPMILQFQQQLYEGLENKEILVPLSQSEWEFLFDNGFALGVFPDGCSKTPAYLLGCVYPCDEENLGHDIGLSEEELKHVAHLEIAMADPKYRGYRMHSRMCALCTQTLLDDGRTQFVMGTVSPSNIPSKKALEFAGLSVVLTKEKYGGKMRHIMLRKK